MERIPSCPDPEALAAWLDQGVTATEREEIEAHLAACDDCRALVVCVLESQSAVLHPIAVPAAAEPAVAPPRVPAFARRKIVWGGWAVGAAAAALVISTQVAPSWWGGQTTAARRLADLADAVGNERTVEARLTGGFRFGPLRAPVRSGGSSAATDNWTLFAAAGRIREDAERDPSAANLHALGLAHLVLGGYDEAVRALEDAVAAAPQTAQYQSDLAGAYLARASQLDRPEDRTRALGAAERALAADAALIEARFNRALALEGLFLDEQARQAWQEYLARDPSSGWSDDARRRLDKLLPGADNRGPRPDLARNNSPPPITDRSVEAGLDWLLRRGLPAWADAILTADPERAIREQSLLRDYAQQISTTSGDAYAASLAASLTAAGATAPARARSVRDFATALLQTDAENIAGAEAAFLSACAQPEDALAVLCDYQLGGIDVVRRKEADAARRVAAIVRRAGQRQWLYPLHLSQRLDGYRLMFQSEYAAAIVPYRNAHDGFIAAKYQRQAGHMAIQLADLFDLVGLTGEGWQWRSTALRLAAADGDLKLRYITRVMTARILERRAHLEASTVFIDAIHEDDRRALTPLAQATLLTERARIRMAAGELAAARQDLQQLSTLIDAASDFRMKRQRPEMLLLRAAIEQHEGAVDKARASLTEAIAGMGPERAGLRAAALLTRAGLTAGVPGRVEASDDVEEAIALLKSRVAHAGQPLRLDEADTAFRAAATAVQSNVELQGVRGLRLVEQLREVLDGVPEGSNHDSGDIMSSLTGGPPGRAVVVYLFAEDALLAWTLSPAGLSFARLRTSPADVDRLMDLLTVQVKRTPEGEDRWRPVLAELYDRLLRDVPAAAGATELTVIPDGRLNRVPFSALYDRRTNQFLFDRMAVRLLPNLSFARGQEALFETRAPVTVAAIGGPLLTGPGAAAFEPLPRARTEAMAVAGLYPKATVVVGEQATKARVLDLLASADVVHYAGHALASTESGGSRLLLAGDVSDPKAALSGSDLRGRMARPATVILAACETAAASVDRAASVAGLSAAFLRSGAGSVVATLWEIDDTASERFFLNVHRALVAGSSTPAAVARAQRTCRSDDGCRRAAATWIGATVYGSH